MAKSRLDDLIDHAASPLMDSEDTSRHEDCIVLLDQAGKPVTPTMSKQCYVIFRRCSPGVVAFAEGSRKELLPWSFRRFGPARTIKTIVRRLWEGSFALA